MALNSYVNHILFWSTNSMGNKKKVQPVNYLHLINSIGGCLGERAASKSFSKIWKVIIKTLIVSNTLGVTYAYSPILFY
jgi:hypothetical protein